MPHLYYLSRSNNLTFYVYLRDNLYIDDKNMKTLLFALYLLSVEFFLLFSPFSFFFQSLRWKLTTVTFAPLVTTSFYALKVYPVFIGKYITTIVVLFGDFG